MKVYKDTKLVAKVMNVEIELVIAFDYLCHCFIALSRKGQDVVSYGHKMNNNDGILLFSTDNQDLEQITVHESPEGEWSADIPDRLKKYIVE